MARRRNIYDASYQTPLADFLDQLPDYFLRYEQLKLQNKRYDNEQAYRAARDKEADRRWDLTQRNQIHQRDFDAKKLQLSDELKQISMAPIGQQDALYEKILPIYSAHPELTGIIKTRIDANNAAEGVADRHLDIQSKISDYKGLGKFGRFGSYYDMLEDKKELSNLRKQVQGTNYQSSIDTDIAKLDEWLEFAKQNADKPMPKNLWEHELDRTNYNQTAQQRSADIKAVDVLSSEIAQERAALITFSANKESVAYKSSLKKINDKQNALNSLVGYEDAEGNKIRGRIDESNAILYGIEQNNKWNPLGGSTQILEDGVFGYEPKTEMKEQDVERYILNNPEQGFDAWMDFLTNPSEESENKFSSMLNEFVEGENIPPSPPPPPPPVELPETVKGALAVIDEKRQGADLVEADDAPVVPDKDKEVEIPAVLGGLKAGQTPKTPVDTTETPPLFPPSPPPSPPSPKDDEFAGVKELSKNRMLEKDGKLYNIQTVSSHIANQIKSIKSINKLYNETPPSNKKTILANRLANQQQKIKDSIEPYISNRTGNFKNKDYNKNFYKLLSKKSKMKEDELKKLILNSLEYNISN